MRGRSIDYGSCCGRCRHGVRWPWYHAATATARRRHRPRLIPDLRRLDFQPLVCPHPTRFLPEEQSLTSPGDKALIVPALSLLPPSIRSLLPGLASRNRTSPRSSLRPTPSPTAPVFPPRGKPTSRHFIRRACCASVPLFSFCQIIWTEPRTLPISDRLTTFVRSAPRVTLYN